MKIDDLFQVVEDRAKSDPELSWTAQLLSQGSDKCAEKFGEEAIEIIIEAAKNTRVKHLLIASSSSVYGLSKKKNLKKYIKWMMR